MPSSAFLPNWCLFYSTSDRSATSFRFQQCFIDVSVLFHSHYYSIRLHLCRDVLLSYTRPVILRKFNLWVGLLYLVLYQILGSFSAKRKTKNKKRKSIYFPGTRVPEMLEHSSKRVIFCIRNARVRSLVGLSRCRSKDGWAGWGGCRLRRSMASPPGCRCDGR